MKESFKLLGLVTQVGLSILFSISFFTILGVYLDRLLKTKGIFTLVCVLVGCFSAFWNTYQLLKKSLPGDSEPK